MTTTLLLGDCLEELAKLSDNSVSSIVTDPPYGLSFMGKKWDYDAPSVDIWKECLRVLKPGGHLLAFAGTRTQHRMAVNIEDAGFEIRDLIAWVYGSGFPKSTDISKAIAKRAGGDLVAKQAIAFMKSRREKMGLSRPQFERLIFGRADGNVRNWEDGISLPRPSLWPLIKQAMSLESTPFDADMERGDDEVAQCKGSYGYQANGERWENERIVRRPTTELAQKWHGWGTALKPALEPITVARKPFKGTVAQNVLEHGTGGINIEGCRVEASDLVNPQKNWDRVQSQSQGIATQGLKAINLSDRAPSGRWPANFIHDGSDEAVALTGDAARFFYCAKSSKRERGEGNNHPTVKPIALMSYLCRLVTPPNGIVLDPFMGSGSTGIAAIKEGFSFIGIERELKYMAIAQRRIEEAEGLCD